MEDSVSTTLMFRDQRSAEELSNYHEFAQFEKVHPPLLINLLAPSPPSLFFKKFSDGRLVEHLTPYLAGSCLPPTQLRRLLAAPRHFPLVIPWLSQRHHRISHWLFQRQYFSDSTPFSTGYLSDSAAFSTGYFNGSLGFSTSYLSGTTAFSGIPASDIDCCYCCF